MENFIWNYYSSDDKGHHHIIIHPFSISWRICVAIIVHIIRKIINNSKHTHHFRKREMKQKKIQNMEKADKIVAISKLPSYNYSNESIYIAKCVIFRNIESCTLCSILPESNFFARHIPFHPCAPRQNKCLTNNMYETIMKAARTKFIRKMNVDGNLLRKFQRR